MKTILVVDDAAVDRRLVGGILSAEPGWTVEFAENGVDALACVKEAPPDVIVTDLQMPDMNGLSLVTAVRESFPAVPVILMTSQGSEELAVRALRGGAANYVPKSRLARDLVQTVQGVLSVAGQRQSHSRLLECQTECEHAFKLESDGALIPQLVGFLQDQVTALGLCDELQRVRIGVAVEEALTNALYHGNLELSSELREHDHDDYQAQVEQRRRQPPYAQRCIHVQATILPAQATIVVRDEGPGFDPTNLPDPTDPANLEKATGRGVFLMRTFMDEVRYDERGNQVTMIKRGGRRRDGESPPA